MPLMYAIQLAVGTYQGLTIIAVYAFLVIMVLTEVLIPVATAGSLRPAAEKSIVFSEGRNVPVLYPVDGFACGTFELIRELRGAGVVTSRGPLATGVAYVQDHLLVFVLIFVRFDV